MNEKEEFLGQLEIFQNLEDDELEALAEICEEFDFEHGAVIAYQRDVAETLIIVRSGRLHAEEVDERGIVRHTQEYLPGDYFEDTWLFVPGTHQATTRGSGSGRIMLIDQHQFLEFLADFPYLLDELELSDEAWSEAEKIRLAQPSRRVRSLSLVAEETIEYNERRSRWLLLVKITPLAALLLSMLVPIVMAVRGNNLWLFGGGMFGAILFAGIALFQYLDWANDYFVITNRHLVHREFDLRRFRARVNKTPIDQVQSVETEKPNLLATLFNIGTARITTAAQAGTIYFDYVDDPTRVKDIVNRLRERVKAMDYGRTQATMRESLEEHFGAQPAYQPVEEMDEEEADDGETPLSVIGRLLKRIARSISYRVEEGSTITYRKHRFTLLAQIWLPGLLGALFLTGTVLSPSIELALAFGFFWLITLGWLVWRFEDWRNDTFQVTDRYVVDIDRRPFGFGESRKQAELGNVQNVNADKPSLLATIFNYGNVHIETAGATADITFETVVNPNQVQSDVFNRREGYRRRQQVQEGQQRRKEYAVLLDVYQQAREQDRLPRRTPP